MNNCIWYHEVTPVKNEARIAKAQNSIKNAPKSTGKYILEIVLKEKDFQNKYDSKPIIKIRFSN